jgi:hypothetical protein
VDRVSLADALVHRDAVLRAFLGPDGRLRGIPARHSKRLVVLDHLAQLFEPGERYDEVEVNRRLRGFHDDVAALRRHLVEDGFLDRAAGVYWRSGGTVAGVAGTSFLGDDPSSDGGSGSADRSAASSGPGSAD